MIVDMVEVFQRQAEFIVNNLILMAQVDAEQVRVVRVYGYHDPRLHEFA